MANITYFSNFNTIQMGIKFYNSNEVTMLLSSKIYSSEVYYHVDFKVLYAWGKNIDGQVSEPKTDVTLLNKQYNVLDETLK